MAFKYAALGTYTTAIAGAVTAPTLKNLADATGVLGNAIDNTGATERDVWSEWDLKVKFAVAPAANSPVKLYFIRAVDGTNYEDGSATIFPVAAFVTRFLVRAVTTQQRIAIPPLILPAVKFKPLLVNQAGQAMTNTDNENILSYRPYNIENV